MQEDPIKHEPIETEVEIPDGNRLLKLKAGGLLPTAKLSAEAELLPSSVQKGNSWDAAMKAVAENIGNGNGVK